MMHSYSVHFAIVLWSSVFICLHFSDNVNITNVIYVLSTQSFMLTLTETYSFSLFNTLSSCTMYTYTHTSLADAIFRISLVFYSNTRVLLHIFFCEAHDFPFVVRSGYCNPTHIEQNAVEKCLLSVLQTPNVSQPFSFCHLCRTTLMRRSENHSFNLFGFCARSF